MVDRIIDYLAGPTAGPWLYRQVICLLLFIIVAVGAWWILSRPHGAIATVCLTLLWLIVLAIWGGFVLPMAG